MVPRYAAAGVALCSTILLQLVPTLALRPKDAYELEAREAMLGSGDKLNASSFAEHGASRTRADWDACINTFAVDLQRSDWFKKATWDNEDGIAKTIEGLKGKGAYQFIGDQVHWRKAHQKFEAAALVAQVMEALLRGFTESKIPESDGFTATTKPKVMRLLDLTEEMIGHLQGFADDAQTNSDRCYTSLKYAKLFSGSKWRGRHPDSTPRNSFDDGVTPAGVVNGILGDMRLILALQEDFINFIESCLDDDDVFLQPDRTQEVEQEAVDDDSLSSRPEPLPKHRIRVAGIMATVQGWPATVTARVGGFSV